MSDINLDANLDTEMKEMRKAQDAILYDPDPQAARNFMHKYNEGEGVGMSDNVILAGIHKARIERGIGVEESTRWLHAHGYSPAMVPI